MPKVPRYTKDGMESRREQVATLRLQHLTQEQIADRLGVSMATVSRDLQAVRDEWAERRTQRYEDWVAEEIAKLDAMEKTWLPAALNGRELNANAVRQVLAIMDRRARMLGLDKPQTHEMTVISQDAVDAEIRRLEAELADHDAG